MNRRGPFVSLRDPAVNAAFAGELLGLMRSWDHTGTTRSSPSASTGRRTGRSTPSGNTTPYHYCLAVLLERFVYFLNRRGVQGNVIAESRGGKEDRRLKESFARLCEKGSATPMRRR